jgi:hypothetical protein
MIGSDGGVFAFGDAGFVGSLPGIGVQVTNVVGAVPTSTGKGYWMVGNDGGVFAFGDAGFLGSLPGLHVHLHNVVGVVTTSDNQGYWMVGSDGGVFAFGDAGFVGSVPGLGVHINNVVAFARQSLLPLSLRAHRIEPMANVDRGLRAVCASGRPIPVTDQV